MIKFAWRFDSADRMHRCEVADPAEPGPYRYALTVMAKPDGSCATWGVWGNRHGINVIDSIADADDPTACDQAKRRAEAVLLAIVGWPAGCDVDAGDDAPRRRAVVGRLDDLRNRGLMTLEDLCFVVSRANRPPIDRDSLAALRQGYRNACAKIRTLEARQTAIVELEAAWGRLQEHRRRCSIDPGDTFDVEDTVRKLLAVAT